jgi:beta-glucosidase
VKAGVGVGPQPCILPPSGRRCTMGWQIYPEGLEPILRRLRSDYQPARLYITENGVPVADTLTASGAVHDDARIEYLREHLQAARTAIAAGVPLAGYFVWSLLDNFEWQLGFTQRFGLAYTDYATQRRIPKDSARFYAALAATNGATLDQPRS